MFWKVLNNFEHGRSLLTLGSEWMSIISTQSLIKTVRCSFFQAETTIKRCTPWDILEHLFWKNDLSTYLHFGKSNEGFTKKEQSFYRVHKIVLFLMATCPRNTLKTKTEITVTFVCMIDMSTWLSTYNIFQQMAKSSPPT